MYVHLGLYVYMSVEVQGGRMCQLLMGVRGGYKPLDLDTGNDLGSSEKQYVLLTLRPSEDIFLHFRQ